MLYLIEAKSIKIIRTRTLSHATVDLKQSNMLLSEQMEQYFITLDFPEIRQIFPYFSPAFGAASFDPLYLTLKKKKDPRHKSLQYGTICKRHNSPEKVMNNKYDTQCLVEFEISCFLLKKRWW